MSDLNFSLSRHLSEFVNAQVANGRHQNASEVIREALRRYEADIRAERANLAAIERLAENGIAAIERGDYSLISGADERQALLDRWSLSATTSDAAIPTSS